MPRPRQTQWRSYRYLVAFGGWRSHGFHTAAIGFTPLDIVLTAAVASEPLSAGEMLGPAWPVRCHVAAGDAFSCSGSLSCVAGRRIEPAFAFAGAGNLGVAVLTIPGSGEHAEYHHHNTSGIPSLLTWSAGHAKMFCGVLPGSKDG